MAISATLLTADGSGTDGSSFSTASVSPGANKLILVAVVSGTATNNTATPTLSGNGLTYDLIDAQAFHANAGSNRRKISLFRAMGASPSSGAITIDFSSETQLRCDWVVVEFDGIDTSGTNGSGAIVQSAKNSAIASATLGLTLATFADAGNGAFAAFGCHDTGGAGATATEDSGWTELSEHATETVQTMQSQWRADNDTSPGVTWSVSTVNSGGIAVEIKAAAGGGGGATASPGVGALTLTGFAPTVSVTAHVTVTPGVGALTLAGFAPTVTASNHQTVTPGTGSLTLAGFAPTIQTPRTVTPGVGALTLEGHAPTVTAGTTAFPGTGALTLAGFAPTVSVTQHVTVTPGTGQLTLAGQAPTVTASDHQTVTPGTGQLTLTGFAPTITALNPQVVTPGVGVLTLAGFAPTITVSVAVPPIFAVDRSGSRYTVTDRSGPRWGLTDRSGSRYTITDRSNDFED